MRDLNLLNSNLLNSSNMEVIGKVVEDPEVQDLIASTIRERERLIAKIVAVAKKHGHKFSVGQQEDTVKSIANHLNLDLASSDVDLSRWLKDRKLTWSRLAKQ